MIIFIILNHLWTLQCTSSCRPHLQRLECSVGPMVPSFIKAYYDCVVLTVRSSVHVGFAFIVIFACKEWWVQSKPFRIHVSLFPISHFLFPHLPFLVLPVPDYVAPTCCSYLHKLMVARVSTLNIFYFSNSTQ